MFEKRWKAVPPQSFISDGTVDGKITVSNSKLFKVKQHVIVKANTLDNLELEVKRVVDVNTIYVGPRTGNIDTRSDLSAYTTLLSASIFANEQQRSKVPEQEIERHTYEEEPVVARRVIAVDELGNPYNASNPLPTTAQLSADNLQVNITQPGTHTIFNPNILLANTEYSVVLPAKTEIFTVMVRSNKAIKLQYTFIAGESGTKYITINPGVRKEFNGIMLPMAKTFYFQLSSTDVGGTIVEIEAWNS